jgi:hypothetical protein
MPHEQDVPVRAPRRGEFFRVDPRPQMRLEVILVRSPEDKELYLVAPNMIQHIQLIAPERLERCMMFTGVNKDGDSFLWPVTLPVPADHPAYQAMDEWLCLQDIH